MIEETIRLRREAVAIFHSAEEFQDAIDELLSSGFHRAELSLLASEAAIRDKLGHRYRRISELADDADVPRSAYVAGEDIGDAEGGIIGGLIYVGATIAAGAVIASGGTLALAIAATAVAAGAGGLVGAVLAKRLGDHHGRYLRGQIEQGGLLLWVHTRTAEDEERSARILRAHCGGNVHIHELPDEE